MDVERLPYDLSGQRILVTGACGGIGQATARLCARLGAELILTDCVAPDGSLLETLACSDGRDHHFVLCDVRDRDAVEALCLAQGPIQAAVLNAGIYALMDWDEADWDEVLADTMDINLAGPVNFARALLPGMKAAGYGRIAMVGSVAAHTGGSFAHAPAHYAASKGALHSFTRWLARRAAPEVMVNLVAPGAIATRMVAMADPAMMQNVPVPRFGRPEEVAWPLAFLCSPGASFICGATLDVNGGAYLR
ncbi:SDR family NAD(P)-dependent oxidoreductase [Kerstersia similis]|uniref:SDR family NAD(P)-dependent oxidoreductase n=1 Tax=Kerstersia similis TaxID=206505 RepID=UPI0039EE3B8B